MDDRQSSPGSGLRITLAGETKAHSKGGEFGSSNVHMT